MVRYRGLEVLDAYIIEEINEQEKQQGQFDGLVPLAPSFDHNYLPENLEEESKEYQSKVIIIDI